jgi:putative hydrolase of the HAD superfamily
MTNRNDNAATNTVRTVIFDLGGVILRTDDLAPRAALAEQVGKTYAELDALVFASPVARLAEEGLASAEDVWEHVRQATGLAPEAVRGFRRSFFGGDRVDFDLITMIRGLRPAYTTVLLSNTWIVEMERFLTEDLHIPTDTFDIVISSAAVRMAKPRTEVFQLALARSHSRAEQAVFVDDNLANIQAARALGIQTIHFRSSAQARAELLSLVRPTGSLG